MCSRHFDRPTVKPQPASFSQPGGSPASAPVPVRAASKLPACHRDSDAAAGTRTSESETPSPGNPSSREGPCRRCHGRRGGATGPAPDVLHQPAGDATVQPQIFTQHIYTIYNVSYASTLVVIPSRSPDICYDIADCTQNLSKKQVVRILRILSK